MWIFSARLRDLLVPNLETSDSIADIVCAPGALLAEFKRRGFKNVTGFDPSPACCATARRLYDIEVRHSTINGLASVTEKFDVVMMTGVLEHLCDVETSLRTHHRYAETRRQAFHCQARRKPLSQVVQRSLSILQHGTREFLLRRNCFPILWRVMGFQPHSLNAFHVISVRMPWSLSSWAFFKLWPLHVVAPASLPFDAETGEAFCAYIESSRKLEEHIQAVIAGPAEARVPLVVWGAGTHTLRLLEMFGCGCKYCGHRRFQQELSGKAVERHCHCRHPQIA